LFQKVIQPDATTPVNSSSAKVEEVKPQSKPTHEIKAYTISSLNKEQELLKQNHFHVSENEKYEIRPFTETDLFIQWAKYAKKMEEQGNMNLNAILTMNKPKLKDNFLISYEVPSDSVKYEIDRHKAQFLGYLRGILHNHDIQLELIVFEEEKQKKIYTPEDKYNHFKLLNPSIELLRQTFGLDF